MFHPGRLDEGYIPVIDTMDILEMIDMAVAFDRNSTYWGNRMFPFVLDASAKRHIVWKLASYAKHRAMAIQLRRLGDYVIAGRHDQICEDIYEYLPDFARW